MRARRANPWLGLGLDAWSLGAESSVVIGLRVLKIAAGGSAGAGETQRMVSEKLEAALVLQGLAVTGRLGVTPHDAAANTIDFYRKRVRANRRRLGRNPSR